MKVRTNVRVLGSLLIPLIVSAIIPGPASSLKAADVVVTTGSNNDPDPFLTSLISKRSGRCADIVGSSKSNGVKIQQKGCSRSLEDQVFWMTAASGNTYTIKSKYSNLCLDVTDVSNSDGAVIQQWECTGSANQSVRILMVNATTFKFQFVHSGKCLDVTDASLKDAALLVQKTCVASSESQQWHMKSL